MDESPAVSARARGLLPLITGARDAVHEVIGKNFAAGRSARGDWEIYVAQNAGGGRT
jgi:hypothetical protein